MTIGDADDADVSDELGPSVLDVVPDLLRDVDVDEERQLVVVEAEVLDGDVAILVARSRARRRPRPRAPPRRGGSARLLSTGRPNVPALAVAPADAARAGSGAASARCRGAADRSCRRCAGSASPSATTPCSEAAPRSAPCRRACARRGSASRSAGSRSTGRAGVSSSTRVSALGTSTSVTCPRCERIRHALARARATSTRAAPASRSPRR